MTWKGYRTYQWTVGFLERGSPEEQVSPVLVIRERRHKMTWAMLVPRKENGVPLDRKESGEVGSLTTSQRLKRWQGKSDKPAKEGSQTVPERPPVGESQSNGIIERAVGSLPVRPEH